MQQNRKNAKADEYFCKALYGYDALAGYGKHRDPMMSGLLLYPIFYLVNLYLTRHVS